MVGMGELGVALRMGIYRVDPRTRKIIEKIWSGEDPFIIALIDTLYGTFANVSVNVVDTGGTSRSITSAVYFGYNGFGALGETLRGIQVGSGSAPVSMSDYALGSLITHGTGSGQLYYYACQTDLHTFSTKRLRIFQRPIANKSGTNITAYEMGLALTTNSNYTCLLARNVISGGVSLVNGGYYVFQYMFEVAP